MSRYSILTAVMKKYLDLDEEIVKNINFEEGKELSFVFDMIDTETSVTVKVFSETSFEVSHGKVKNKKITSTSFEKFLTDLMDSFVEERDKKIEFYTTMDTPTEEGTTPLEEDEDIVETPTRFEDDEDDEEDDEDDEEEEGEEGDSKAPMYVIASGDDDSPGIGMSQSLGGLMGSDLQNMKLLREPPYEIQTPKQLLEMQHKSISKISENLFVSESGAHIILRAYRWKEEKILNTFLKSGKDKVLKEVGLKKSSKVFSQKISETRTSSRRRKKKKEEMFECPSCYDDVGLSETYMIEACQHRFCVDCWKEHLTYKIKDGLSKRILCMSGNCKCVVDETVVSRFIKDPILKKKYDTKLLESFVEDNDQMKWCQSAPHCGNAVMVRVSPLTPLEVHCSCEKIIFCFNCLEEAHNPASCSMLQAWKKKCSDDSETLNWIKANTRECPYCHQTVQKNGGCNHISCKCGKHWCWACGGKMEGSHNCNRYKESEEDKSSSRQSLDRYLHYYNHFNAHHTSLKNQKKMKKKVDQKIRRMYQSRPNSAWVEVEWLKRGLNVLFDTRRALMYSYVFAFYLFDKSAQGKGFKKVIQGCRRFRTTKERERIKNLFEDTQEQLELTTEALNKYLDLPLDKILKEFTKREVLSKSVLNEKRIHGLFDVIREEMIIEGEFKLPDPRYIVTNPSFEANSIKGVSVGGKEDSDARRRMNRDQYGGGGGGKNSNNDAALDWAIQASLREAAEREKVGVQQSSGGTDDDLFQQALLRSLQEK